VSIEFADTEWSSTSIRGSTLEAVAQTVSTLPEAAKTEWFPTYVTTTTGDVVSDASVTVRTRVTMPQWSGYASASQSEKDEWDRFCAALRAHEQGHLSIVSDQLSGVDARLVGLSSDAARDAWNDALAALGAASDAYDVATDHGRNQGTVITLGP
jgi:predicted secreted Zn-dependent protease